MITAAVDTFLETTDCPSHTLKNALAISNNFLLIFLEAYRQKQNTVESVRMGMITNPDTLHDTFDTYFYSEEFLEKLRSEMVKALVFRGYTFEDNSEELRKDERQAINH
jgi:hypothetical protein